MVKINSKVASFADFDSEVAKIDHFKLCYFDNTGCFDWEMLYNSIYYSIQDYIFENV
jgi:hypothetical protein